MRLRRHLTLLTMTTALVAATAAGAWAQETTSKEMSVDLSSEAQPFDITSHLRAMHGMTVVNHKGQRLGKLYDVVVDFSNKEVIYALMSAEPGQRQGQQQTEDQQRPAEAESESEQARMVSGALYPIPIETIAVLDRSVLELLVANKTRQMAEGEQQTTEGEQLPQSLADMTVGEVVGMTVVSEAGEFIADIQAIVDGRDQAVAVLGVGGFLGIGEKQVGVRLDQLTLNHEGTSFILATTREELDNAPEEIQYGSEQTVPEDTRMARLMEPGQQGQPQQKAQSSQREETETQGQAKQQDQMAAAETKAETEAGAWTAEEITTLRGKVLMVSISKEKLQQAPSFEQGNLPDVADAEWQQAVLAFYQEILGTEDTDPAMGPGTESPEGETKQ